MGKEVSVRKAQELYPGHKVDIFKIEDMQKCSECGGDVKIVLVDFNNRELATECSACGQGFSLSHDLYSTDELHRMLDIVE